MNPAANTLTESLMIWPCSNDLLFICLSLRISVLSIHCSRPDSLLMSFQVHIEIHWVFNACVWTLDFEHCRVSALLKKKKKPKQSVRKCGGRRSDSANWCDDATKWHGLSSWSALVTWAQCLRRGKDDRIEPGWASDVRGWEERGGGEHAWCSPFLSWASGSTGEDCAGRRVDLDAALKDFGVRADDCYCSYSLLSDVCLRGGSV